jgi:hypothetical protein
MEGTQQGNGQQSVSQPSLSLIDQAAKGKVLLAGAVSSSRAAVDLFRKKDFGNHIQFID